MQYSDRATLYKAIESDRKSKVILYATSDRPGMETQITNDVFDFFVQHLDKIWPAKKITLILHTSGGDTAAAWRIINLLRIFCDDLEVIVPNKAHSSGTLISLGANTIILTKQATLGPIDPSLTGPLSPPVPNAPHQRVSVSVEAVQGYIDIAKKEIGITDDKTLGTILLGLSNQVHPLVLGQIFRTKSQIRSLAGDLLDAQKVDEEKKQNIIDFLCSESGSHDRTINRREAKKLGLKIEKPSAELYEIINDLYASLSGEMELRTKFDPAIILGKQPATSFECKRVLLESISGGSNMHVTKGDIRDVTPVQNPGPGMPVPPAQNIQIQTQITFDGWI